MTVSISSSTSSSTPWSRSLSSSSFFPAAGQQGGRQVRLGRKVHWDYIYEPDAKALLDELIKRYIQSQVYSAVLENLASEQSARMVAMKAASENAGSLIDSLQLEFNKARQAGITQEITEIVSGAAAV